ncbi:Nucleotidylyl transferase [Mycena rebaudengoi]|nr:Nucleotidylyl transferase [Mycena rebaudengoi]
MASCAVLYATLLSLSVPHFLAPAIAHASKQTEHCLSIVLVADAFDPDHSISHTGSWNDVQQLLTFVYVQATKVAQDMDRLLMSIDVLLKGPNEPLPESVTKEKDAIVYRVEGDPTPLPTSLAHFRLETLRPTETHDPPESTVALSSTHPSLFPVVALGGTFDHLHAGHKILLSMAAWIAHSKLIVGVTDDALLTRKSNAHILESLADRTRAARNFLSAFKPSLTYDIVPINDVYGPTGWDPNIQALVVSKETAAGAKSIAEHRASHALPSLEVFTIDVISATSTNLSDEDAEMLKQTKMSSTYIRQWIVAKGVETE